jgi:hypothetical protein
VSSAWEQDSTVWVFSNMFVWLIIWSPAARDSLQVRRNDLQSQAFLCGFSVYLKAESLDDLQDGVGRRSRSASGNGWMILEVRWFEAGMFGDTGKHFGANLFMVVESESEILESRAGQKSVFLRSAARTCRARVLGHVLMPRRTKYSVVRGPLPRARVGPQSP